MKLSRRVKLKQYPSKIIMLRKRMRHLSISITRSIESGFVSPYRERLKMLDWIFQRWSGHMMSEMVRCFTYPL